MYNFDKVLSTKKKSCGVNTDQYIVLHHTGNTGPMAFTGNCKVLSGNTGATSTHFIVGPNGETAKIGDPKDILRHAGTSKRGNLTGMNKYSMGIEIVGPDADGRFSDVQYKKAIHLIKYLMKALNIPAENVLKHSDITRAGSGKKILRDGKSKSRKPDLAPSFRQLRGFKNFDEFRKSL